MGERKFGRVKKRKMLSNNKIRIAKKIRLIQKIRLMPIQQPD